jgi:type IX secretion system PorP/SprF family membrane protein
MNSIYIKTVFSILFMVAGFQALAQRDAMYTHYMYNTQVVNPAYVGSRHAFTVTALHRSQWASYFPGNPVTQSLTLHSPLRNENIGLGLAFYNDELGPERTTAINADFSYSVRLTEASKLSFGLKGGVRMHSINLIDLAAVQPDDPAIMNNYESLWLPNFGFGAYYSRERFYAGFSIPALMEENFLDNTVNSGARYALLQRHYYFIAGTIFPISSDVSFKPTTLVKMTKGAPIELDFTASFYFYDRFSLGAMFRTEDAVGAMVGLRISDQWSIGYSYDWSILNRIPNNNFGTHEVFLRYDFLFLESHRVKSPRYF